MLQDEIQTAIKNKKAILGYRKSLKFIKFNTPKLIVMSENIPEKIKKIIEENAKITKVKINLFDGTSKEFGIFCGKSFPISILVIKD